ncbi:adenylyltransferase/cytidyltransferase family protein, partial [Campylobacter jejuni]
MKNVITFGTFDLFHYGHLRILESEAEEIMLKHKIKEIIVGKEEWVI